MKTINLNFSINNLEDVAVGNAGKIIAGQLVSCTKEDALKFYDWATALYKEKEIKVDASDFTKIKDFIINSEVLTILTKAQVLKYLNSVEEDK